MSHHDVVVIGGGNAGLSLAAKVVRDGARDVAIVESESVHRYRPMLNYVASGEARMRDLERPAATVMPGGATWIQDRVVSCDPDGPSVTTQGGQTIGCRTLVIATGFEEDWDATPGLREAYCAGWAGSSFLVESAPRVWPALRDLTSGRVVFSVPPEPAPCAATALKPLFMACDHWRRQGVLQDLEVHLVLPGPTPVGVPTADPHLEEALTAYGVHVVRDARVTAAGARAVTVTTRQGEAVLDDLAYAHVVPTYRAPDWIAEAGLADGGGAGLVDVDHATMRHRRHHAIWSLGDVAGLGIRPSGGALRKQVGVLAANILASRAEDFEHYDGYTVMPITVARHTLSLVEIDRDGRSAPSVPALDLVKPRRLTWAVDRYALPVTYFRRILRGKV